MNYILRAIYIAIGALIVWLIWDVPGLCVYGIAMIFHVEAVMFFFSGRTLTLVWTVLLYFFAQFLVYAYLGEEAFDEMYRVWGQWKSVGSSNEFMLGMTIFCGVGFLVSFFVRMQTPK